MAGNVKDGKPSASSPKGKQAGKAPSAPAVQPSKAETKPAVQSSKAETKPAVQPSKAETKPAAQPSKAEKAPSRPAARLLFKPGWTQAIEGDLVGGCDLTLLFDPDRAYQLPQRSGDGPVSGVQAFVKLVPSGQVVEQPAVDLVGAVAKTRPVTVEIPRGTTEIQVWFKCWESGKPGEAWDSNFGENYKFAVRAQG